jgi:methylmalonyl-CoA/ethylmalonyl-CoA epimerase
LSGMRVDHVGVAVADLAAARRFFEDLGLACTGEEEVEEQRVRVALFPVGESRVELLESLDPEGPVGKFIARKGPGLHHLSLHVPDLEAALAALAAKGYDLIDRTPRIGAGGHRIAFIHPRSTGGVLLELCEGG